MTVFEFGVTYAVCWWLVLFMLLPQGAAPVASPAPGHARSAPANPRIRRKLKLATLFAFLPAIALYVLITNVKAETIYHAGSGCKPLDTYVQGTDVEVRDGYATGGKKVASATMNPQTGVAGQERYDIPLLIPTAKYVSPRNVDLSQSFADVGTLSVGRNGSTTLNDKEIAPAAAYPEGCEHEPANR